MLVILEESAEHLSSDVGFIAAVARCGVEQLIVPMFVILMEEKRIEDQQLMQGLANTLIYALSTSGSKVILAFFIAVFAKD